MTNNFIILALIIPTLLVFPYLMSTNAFAFKITDTEIQIEVHFNKTDFTNLDTLFNDLDDGLIEENIHDEFSPIAVGQWNFNPEDLNDPTNDIVSDWNININHLTGLHKLLINPTIIEINLPQGTNYPSIQDQLVNEGRGIITDKLTNYGITEFKWFLFFEGGLIIEEESS